LRELIRYANHLHSIGMLDLVLATGDLVDYLFEADDNPNGPGNFDLFRRILFGQAPSSDPNVPSEELRVPIFTIPGNHDYRHNPYRLCFEAYLDDLVIEYISAFQKDINNYAPHNLTQLEALAIDAGGKPVESRTKVAP